VSETETETKAEEGSLMMMVFAMLNPVEAECEQREGREESREDPRTARRERERDGEKRDVFCCYFIIRDGSPCRAASACIHGMII
jgi:hypothetical protein